MSEPQPTRSRQRRSRRTMLGLLAAAPVAAGAAWAVPGMATARSLQPEGSPAGTATDPELEEKIRHIIDKPEFNGTWALKATWLDSGEPICALNPTVPHRAASSIKVFIAGTAFEALGPDQTFPTRIYATGPIRHGVLHGDLVLVAGGDLLLGCRIQPDGSMALPQPDHTYAHGADPKVQPLPGDPLQTFRDLAEQISAKGVRRVAGDVVVDTSLFPQVAEPAGRMPITASPMMINDNVIDVTITAGAKAGDAARIELSPQTSYLRIVNQVRTIAADTDSAEPLHFAQDVARPDGTRVVTLAGAVPEGTPPLLHAYHLPDPARFAEIAFATTLRDAGIDARPAPKATDRRDQDKRDQHRAARSGRPLVELVTMPLSKQIWPMLKVSNNPHTAAIPHLVGATAADEHENPEAAYEKIRSDLFIEAGLDPYPPGSEEEKHTADFFVTFLDHISRKPYIQPYLDALGHDNPAGVPAALKGGSGTRPHEDGIEFHLAVAGYLMPPGKAMVGLTILTQHVATSNDPVEQQKLDKLIRSSMSDILATVYESIA